MTLVQVAIDVLMSIGVLAVFVLCGYSVVLWARRSQKRAYVVGALLSPFIANVSDPDFRILNEAKQLKKREEDEPGDPPDLVHESILDQVAGR
jgi:hypothetical protein